MSTDPPMTLELGESVERSPSGIPTAWRLFKRGENALTLSGTPHTLELSDADLQRIETYYRQKGTRIPIDSRHFISHLATRLKRDESAIWLFRMTIWNPYAEIKEDIVGNRRRICIFVKDKDSGELTNIWVTKDNDGKLVLELVDSWFPNRQYVEHLGSKHKKNTLAGVEPAIDAS